MKFRIQHVSGSKAGQEQVVEGKAIRIGRDPSCDIAFDPMADDKVSANHAQILVLDNGEILLSDLGSSNGTYVNDQKIAQPTPLTNGMKVTFGEGGPDVVITMVAPEAPAEEAAPPPPKKGGKGCMIFALLGGCFMLCVIAAIVAYFLAGDEPEMVDPDMPTPTETEVATEDPTPEESPEEPEVLEKKHPWENFGVGSVIVTKSVTDMEVAGNKMKTEAEIKYELTALDDETATVKMETIASGVTTPSEMTVELHPEVTGEGDEIQYDEEETTTVTVPAGEFSCIRRKWTQSSAGQESTMEVWMDEDMPVPYKSIMTTKTMTSVSEMTTLDKK